MPENQIPLLVVSSASESRALSHPFGEWGFQNYILVTTFIMNILSFMPAFEVVPVDLRTKQRVTFMVEWDQPQIPCSAREVWQCWVIWYVEGIGPKYLGKAERIICFSHFFSFGNILEQITKSCNQFVLAARDSLNIDSIAENEDCVNMLPEDKSWGIIPFFLRLCSIPSSKDTIL